MGSPGDALTEALLRRAVNPDQVDVIRRVAQGLSTAMTVRLATPFGGHNSLLGLRLDLPSTGHRAKMAVVELALGRRPLYDAVQVERLVQVLSNQGARAALSAVEAWAEGPARVT